MKSFKVVGRGKGGVSDFGEEAEIVSQQSLLRHGREINVPWDLEKGA